MFDTTGNVPETGFDIADGTPVVDYAPPQDPNKGSDGGRQAPVVEGFSGSPTFTPDSVETRTVQTMTDPGAGRSEVKPQPIGGPTREQLAQWAKDAEANAEATPITEKAKSWLATGNNKLYAGGAVLALVAVLLWLKFK